MTTKAKAETGRKTPAAKKTAPRRKVAPKAAPAVATDTEQDSLGALRRFRDAFTGRIEDIRETVGSGFGDARDTAGKTAAAFGAAGRAYVTGVGEIGRTVFGFGREAYSDAVEHVQASFKAKDLRTVAELQAAFLQNRVEQSAAHANELVEVARDQVEASIKPIIDLLDGKKAA